jgi:Mn-containing catalase
VTTRLAHQTQKTAGISNGMRTATVAAVVGSVVTISVAGGSFSSGVGFLASYAPTVGDVVAVFRQDSSWLILGRVA